MRSRIIVSVLTLLCDPAGDARPHRGLDRISIKRACKMGPAGPPETQGLLTGARVLVVEDDFIILSGLESLLTEVGAEVIISRTVRDALVKARARVSVAILDVAIADQTVEPVVARLAEGGVPFLFYTGKLGTDELLVAWPGHRVVTKPADAKTLVAAVAALWSEKRERARATSALARALGGVVEIYHSER